MNKPAISVKPKSKSRYKQGVFKPVNPLKYQGTVPITYRSGWELKFMKWLDLNTSVLLWASESLIIPYISPIDNRQHRYFVDFLAKMRSKDGSVKTYAIEIKPKKEMLPPKKNKNVNRMITEISTYEVNQAKWVAAREYCSKRDVEFIVLNEEDLHIK